jgi:pimeloyl-ACP methyl ester carboxylesterase
MWTPRYEREIAHGKLGAALVTVMKGLGGESFMEKLPRFILVPLMTLACKNDKDSGDADTVPIKDLIPTFHYDSWLASGMTGMIEAAANINADVLLLGGSKSPAFLKDVMNALNSALPNAKCVEFKGFGHTMSSNEGNPKLVAEELRRFFRTHYIEEAQL